MNTILKLSNDYLNLHFYGIESIGNFKDASKCKKYCLDIFPCKSMISFFKVSMDSVLYFNSSSKSLWESEIENRKNIETIFFTLRHIREITY